MDQYNHLVPTTVTYNATTFYRHDHTDLGVGLRQPIHDRRCRWHSRRTRPGGQSAVGHCRLDLHHHRLPRPRHHAAGRHRYLARQWRTGYTVNGSIVVTFSEPLNAATINGQTANILLNGVTPRSIDRRLSTVHQQHHDHSTTPLSYGLSYAVYIVGGSTGIRDLSGNALASNFSSS